MSLSPYVIEAGVENQHPHHSFFFLRISTLTHEPLAGDPIGRNTQNLRSEICRSAHSRADQKRTETEKLTALPSVYIIHTTSANHEGRKVFHETEDSLVIVTGCMCVHAHTVLQVREASHQPDPACLSSCWLIDDLSVSSEQERRRSSGP